MSDQAFQIYERAQSEQHNRNEARRIRTRVSEARGRRGAAETRWPFELTQNALDGGPREGRSSVTISVRKKGSHVVFEHDGAPFNTQELAALLSGGSSKEFESEVTTGRFGTGFLVTHVLSERARLRGLLQVEDHLEQFELILDRGGDEETILQNIVACNAAIRAASPISSEESRPSASFEYEVGEDATTFVAGFDALTRALPYLYGTRPALGAVELEAAEGVIQKWTPGERQTLSFNGGQALCRSLLVEQPGGRARDVKVYRFMTHAEAGAAALVVVERTDIGWRVIPPDVHTPRIFREYPVRAATFLPISFVFDGKFSPDQERAVLHMDETDRALLEDAFSAAVIAVQFAFEQRWDSAHRIAHVRRPTTVFDGNNAVELSWWCDQLLHFADRLARLPLIDCGAEDFLPLISDDGPFADAVIPRLLASSSSDETSVERLWPLVAACTNLNPPRLALAADWTRICEDWYDLGVGLEDSRVTVQKLAEYVKEDAAMLADLRVEGSPANWLASFLDVVGECWDRRAGADASVLDGMLPNQNQRLCAPASLRQDDGVSELLKQICAQLGDDVRERLLLDELRCIAERDGLQFFSRALDAAVGLHLSESDVLEEIARHLGRELPEDEDCDEDSTALLRGGVRLLAYLWRIQGPEAAVTARGLPLISRKQRVVRWSADRLMMAPVVAWPESARPFAAAYPDNRVLSDLYAGIDEEPGCVDALIAWGIAIPEPISSDEPSELRDRRLAVIAASDAQDVIVSGQRFSQIALLPREVMNHCKVGLDEARALLGLVLKHVAPRDPAWQATRIVKARRNREDYEIVVREALWLADLKFMAWVPMVEEEGKGLVPHLASVSTLTTLLDPAWLENNDAAIRLLSDWFGFDELDLRLLGVAPNEEKRNELRASLARLIESGGADAELYMALAKEVEARQRRERDVAFCQKLGWAVQEAIREALEAHGLELQLVDRGFDYKVTLPPENALEELASQFEVGPYFLEVKATTTGNASLTPLQAQTAASEPSFVLCVVDLRNVPGEELQGDWTAAKIAPLAKILTNLRQSIDQTWRFVEAARESPIGIRNDSALRYQVPVSLLEGGQSIGEWVFEIQQSLVERATV